ncbi:cytochrome P450 [Actinoplanes sp. N902-109]|uniref:cytochrome P450 n=1 Tax=Actinoplanes sp. (strain N902-109) TaxID=649831 RepID=UPI0006861FB6|nr:cytochrome P450 [Actinoplanes sp. N902-109]
MDDGGATGRCPYAGPATVAERTRRWSIYQPWLQEDPVSRFNEMREQGPIVRSEEFGGYWIFTRYEDIEWAARNPEIFSNAQVGIPHREIFPAKQIPVQLDGDEHRKWRLALSDLFNPGVVNHFTPQFRQAVIDTIEPLVPQGQCDFVQDVAVKLPAEAFLINFGIGREYLQPLLDHKNWLRREGLPNARNDEEIKEANKPFWDFFSDAIDRRRAEGTEGRRDVLSQLINSTYDGRPPTQDEMINAAFVTMLAALDTTTAALGLIFQYLARHPEAQKLVVAQPERIPVVIEELMRHEPVVSTGRLVTRDVERHGVQLRAGDRVLLSWGMSGLDPAAFDHADEVDFDRSSTRHLAFAVGPHRCLGMFVARRMMKLAVEEWHARVPSYRITAGATPEAHYSPARGLRSLPLTFG